jgi:hypothetical protein
VTADKIFIAYQVIYYLITDGSTSRERERESYGMLADLGRRSAEQLPVAAHMGKEGLEGAGQRVKEGLQGVQNGIKALAKAIVAAAIIAPVAATLPVWVHARYVGRERR